MEKEKEKKDKDEKEKPAPSDVVTLQYVRFYGIGQVWNNDSKRYLCEFSVPRNAQPGTLGVFETNEPYIITQLRKLGFKEEAVK